MKYVKRPCDECPWRQDATPGRFDPERWAGLAASSPSADTGFGPDFGAPMFACHKTPESGERACAGWLAQAGHAHPSVRMAVYAGNVPPEALAPGPDWPPLHPTFDAAARHDLQRRSNR